MAETFEAIRRGPGGFSQRVCLKLVLPFFRDNTDFLRMFEREARLAATLRHTNIVGVIDFGRIDDVTYMALQLVDGIDLGMLLDAQPSGRLPYEQVSLIGDELARALEHAHDPCRESPTDGSANKAIIHRDVSPSNIMISRRGEILLSDFGVAKAIAGTARQPSAVKGKVPYMSPEQLRAEHLDGRSDLFALGVVLYEALAGQRPYVGEHDPATIMLILKGDRPALSQLAPLAPAALCDVIESLLEPDRAKRPESATALLDLLEPFAPSPRTRRELGKAASELRDEKDARSSELPASGEEDSDLQARRRKETSGVSRTSGALAAAGSVAASRSRSEEGRPRNRRVLAWALAVFAAIGAAVAFWPSGAGDSGERAVDSAPIFAAPDGMPTRKSGDQGFGPATGSESNDSTKERKVAESAKPVAVPSRPARLNVVVFPWGDVWINGKRRGAAPLKNVSLKPGRYKISAGPGQPSKSKIVRLRDGERRTIEFDLTE